jgi:hypothetical protein
MEPKPNDQWHHAEIIRNCRDVLFHSLKTVDGVLYCVVSKLEDGQFKEISRTPADQLTA